MAGFTTERDLGTEGAGFADVGLKQAIDQGIVPGPRLLVSTRAIVARGAYGPKGFEPGVAIPQGAQEVAGADEIDARRPRPDRRRRGHRQILRRLHWGKGEPSRPTLSQAELDAGVAAAHDAGRLVAVHATTAEGMRRAILAGADTIEHGYGGTAEVFKMMHDRGNRAVPDASPRRKPTRAISSIGTAVSPRPKASRKTAAPSAGDEGRRADLHGRRRRRLHPRAELARDGRDAARRHARRAGADRRHLGQRADLPPQRPRRRSSRDCSPTSSRSMAIRPATSRRCAASSGHEGRQIGSKRRPLARPPKDIAMNSFNGFHCRSCFSPVPL